MTYQTRANKLFTIVPLEQRIATALSSHQQSLPADSTALVTAAMKLDVNALRYLSREDFRVLTAVEMGQKNVR